MKKIVTIPTIIGIILLMVGVASGVILLKNQQIFRLGATAQNSPRDVRVSNNNNTSFVISWYTDTPTQGFVKLGESDTDMNTTLLDQIREKSISHYVIANNLKPQTMYYFKINSEGVDYDFNGNVWSAQTQVDTPSQSTTISGRILDNASVPATGAIVFVQIGETPLLSFSSPPTSSDGTWIITLTSDSPLEETSVLNIFVQAGPAGSSTAKIRLGAAKPVPDITLGKNSDFTNINPANLNNVEDATLDLPDDSVTTPKSKFNVDADLNTSPTITVSLDSLQEGETLDTATPEFFGEGPPDTTITITVESDPITQVTKTDSDGDWNWSPPTLEPGEHTITITWRDAAGILRTISRSFRVEVEASDALVNLATPTPTPSPTPKVTPTPTASATPSPSPLPIPQSGTLTPTLVLLIMGIGLLLLSLSVVLI